MNYDVYDPMEDIIAAEDYRREAYGAPCPGCGTLTWGGDCPRCYQEEDRDEVEVLYAAESRRPVHGNVPVDPEPWDDTDIPF